MTAQRIIDYIYYLLDNPALIVLFVGCILFIIYYVREMCELFYKAYCMRLKVAPKSKAHGIILGKRFGLYLYSPVYEEAHAGLYGGSGSGKTWGVIIPTLRSWLGGFFSIDISGDISSKVDCKNKLVYEPLNPATVPYDVFHIIDKMTDDIDIDEALQNLALMLVPQIATTDAAIYFERTGRDIIAAALFTFYRQSMDFFDICDKIVSTSAPALLNEIDSFGYGPAIKKINQFEGIDGKPVKDLPQSKQAANQALEPITNGRLKSSLRRPSPGELSMNAESIEEYNCFLNIPDDVLEQYSCIVEIVVGQLLRYLSGRDLNKKKRLFVCIDEFSSFSGLNIKDMLAKYRKRRVRCMIGLQSINQLDDNYSATIRKIIMSNCDLCVVCKANEPDEQEYLSKKAEEKKVKKKVKDSMGETTSYREEYVPAFRPKDFEKLRRHNIIMAEGFSIKIRKTFRRKILKPHKNDEAE